ncbi:hypothetical protein [Marichromatium bheemlicum]|uniref:Uncharacterized protein n=1 Tax=Marichromatium bheemlicum TaxID=365339 RepID=A0ABX1IB13_9GAMM|nr:hypothetical protein [Marichromatium bheemlicum]NKN33387.1 hypothetical protein [Marichromatium bheemlicum]
MLETMRSGRGRLACMLVSLAGLLGGPLTSASAQGVNAKPTALEIAALPPYCQARLNRDRAQMDQWIGAMGKDLFTHIHHYCNGMVYFNRANAALQSDTRNALLSRAISEFNYVIKRWPTSFVLYQQAGVYKSMAEMMKTN